jgi:hypothetical protein
LRWWRWLIAIDVEWDRATSAEVQEFVLWMQRTTKPRRSARTKSAATAGTVGSNWLWCAFGRRPSLRSCGTGLTNGPSPRSIQQRRTGR